MKIEANSFSTKAAELLQGKWGIFVFIYAQIYRHNFAKNADFEGVLFSLSFISQFQ